MDKIRKLEQRWYNYKIRKVSSSMFIFLLFPLFIVGGYFIGVNFDKLENILFNKENSSNLEAKIVTPKEEEKNITIVPLLISSPPLKIEKKEALALEPVIPIIDMDKERVKRSKVKSSHRKQVASKTVHAKRNSYLTVQELKNVKDDASFNGNRRDTTRLKKIHLHSSSIDYMEKMKMKFLKSQNPREALLLAKAFYKQGAYAKAENWALRANKIDSNLDESWIIFAQSKAKMAKKEEAIKILVAYYNKTKSNKVKTAITRIKRGKI